MEVQLVQLSRRKVERIKVRRMQALTTTKNFASHKYCTSGRSARLRALRFARSFSHSTSSLLSCSPPSSCRPRCPDLLRHTLLETNRNRNLDRHVEALARRRRLKAGRTTGILGLIKINANPQQTALRSAMTRKVQRNPIRGKRASSKSGHAKPPTPAPVITAPSLVSLVPIRSSSSSSKGSNSKECATTRRTGKDTTSRQSASFEKPFLQVDVDGRVHQSAHGPCQDALEEDEGPDLCTRGKASACWVQ